MFTGLIEKIGIIENITRRGMGYSIQISHSAWDVPLKSGDSIAVCGACLTATEPTKTSFTADMLIETADRTSLGNKQKGSLVNLERAMSAEGRFGGHFVSGHVDGTGVLKNSTQSSEDYILTVEVSEELMDGIILKGSITLDGISLTVANIDSNSFEVHIIPTTWKKTNLASLSIGSIMNIETDMIGKYVKQFMMKSDRSENNSKITMDILKNAGF